MSTPQTAPVLPPDATRPEPALPRLPKLDITQILTGDWPGAALTALATLLTAFVASALLVALMHPDGVGVRGFLTVVTLITGSAFGGNTTGHVSDQGPGTISVGAYPLTVTVLALAVATVLLSRQLRRYPDWTGAAIHAVRTALVFAAGIVVLTLVFRSTLFIPATFGDVSNRVTQDNGTFALESGTWSSHAGGAAAVGVLFLLLIAAGLILMRDDTLPPAVVLVRGWVAGPLRSIGVLVAGSVALGAIAAVVLFVKDSNTHNTSSIAIWLAILPNLGITALYTGAGAGLHYVTHAGKYHLTTSQHLTHFTDHLSPVLWGLPVLTLVVFGASALFLAYRSGPGGIQADMLRWLVALVVATPILVHLAAYHATYRSGARGKQVATITVGIDSWQAIGLALAWGFAIALVVTAVARSRAQRSGAAPTSWSGPTG
ncbi:MAG TPA: hypothetical protein VHW64_09615 [Nocardioides sp.]|uniref:hypothetical protein n=1 Tax=Nocardioides sp. TaxID=35761 RepID=UPI002E32F7F7|nr:hypothetical protein [Nocardioides sp.]HEX3930951.1 hypothetical protein [Nocardioides sp.]